MISEQDIRRVVERWNDGRDALTAAEEHHLASRVWRHIARVETDAAIVRMEEATRKLAAALARRG